MNKNPLSCKRRDYVYRTSEGCAALTTRELILSQRLPVKHFKCLSSPLGIFKGQRLNQSLTEYAMIMGMACILEACRIPPSSRYYPP